MVLDMSRFGHWSGFALRASGPEGDEGPLTLSRRAVVVFCGGEVAAAEATPTPNANIRVNKCVRICFHLFSYRRNGFPAAPSHVPLPVKKP